MKVVDLGVGGSSPLSHPFRFRDGQGCPEEPCSALESLVQGLWGVSVFVAAPLAASSRGLSSLGLQWTPIDPFGTNPVATGLFGRTRNVRNSPTASAACSESSPHARDPRRETCEIVVRIDRSRRPPPFVQQAGLYAAAFFCCEPCLPRLRKAASMPRCGMLLADRKSFLVLSG